jgi:catechol 2,3-dioxygenase-like lactoylglutathione lyase family enzyme
MKIDSIDHVVFTVKDINATCEFYTKVLGMEIVTFGEGRKALAFGSQKINLQQLGRESTLIADKPTSGSADICFVTSVPISEVIAHLNSCGVRLVGGPVERNGARGMMASVYFRDPDLSLVEVSNYASS